MVFFGKKEKPRISVVIPAYNEEKYLERALRSIKNQTLKPFEIIVVDSYSRDRTQSIAKRLGARVLLDKKGNIGRSRDKGFRAARGDIIVSTSADVFAPRNWIEELTKPIIRGKAVCVYGSIYLINPRPVEKLFAILLNKCIAPVLARLGFIFATADNIAVKKEAYERVAGFPHLNTGEDTLLIKKLLSTFKGKVVYREKARIYTSRRRIEKWGAFRYFLFHLKNFLAANLFGKTEKHYKPVR